MSFCTFLKTHLCNIYVEIKDIFSNSCIYLQFKCYLFATRRPPIEKWRWPLDPLNLSIFLTPFCQHELLQPGQHGEHPGGVGQPVVGQGLHQAGVHHTEGVGEALQCLHSILVCQVIPGKYDSNIFLPVDPESTPENINGSRSLEMFPTQLKIPLKTSLLPCPT